MAVAQKKVAGILLLGGVTPGTNNIMLEKEAL
jgi:hypothetical protein